MENHDLADPEKGDVGNTLGGTESVGAGAAIGDGGQAETDSADALADESMDQDTDQ